MVCDQLRQLNNHLYVTANSGGITVYLDQQLLVQVKLGMVTAFQAHNAAQGRLIQRVFDVLGLEDYSMIGQELAHYTGDDVEIIRRLPDGGKTND